MAIYSFYIFDRHCAAVYYQDWHRSPLKPARNGPNVLPCVSPAVSPSKQPNQPLKNPDQARQLSSKGILPFANRTGVLIGGEEVPTHLQSLVSSSVLKSTPAGGPAQPPKDTRHEPNSPFANLDGQLDDQHKTQTKHQSLIFDEEAKLVYGVIFSLRNMVQKLAGRDELLHYYTTSTYTLHILTTPTNHTFVLFTSPMTESLRSVLKNLWKTSWLEFVVRNPLVSIDSNQSGRGVDNEMFRRSVDNLMRSLSNFN